MRSPFHSKVETPVLIPFSRIEPREIQWLWPYRFLLGMLNILFGDPKVGKSMVAVDLAARVSAGLPWPDRPDRERRAGDVIILSAEDDPSVVLRPRLDAAGGDPARVQFLRGVSVTHNPTAIALSDPKERQFKLKEDIDLLAGAVQELARPRLIVIDPLSAYLGGADAHRDTEVRQVLYPLTQLAERRGVAIVAVMHCNKNGQAKAMHRAMGSVAFVAAARSVQVIGRDRNDPDRRLMLPAAMNYGKGETGMAYWIVRRKGDLQPRVKWDPEPVRDFDVAEALNAPGTRHDGTTKMERAEQLLREALAVGPVAATELIDRAEQEGIGERTLEAAKKALGIESKKEGGAAGLWVWRLPG